MTERPRAASPAAASWRRRPPRPARWRSALGPIRRRPPTRSRSASSARAPARSAASAKATATSSTSPARPLANGFKVGGKTYRRHHHRPGHAVRPGARRPARQGPDQQPGHRHDAHHLDARSGEPGGRRLRGGGRAVPRDDRAVGSVLFRPRRQAGRTVAVQVDLLLQLRHRHLRQDLSQHVAADRRPTRRSA